MPDRHVRWHWLGRAAYRRVLADQLAARERVWAGGDGVILLCEHPPVLTLGRSATTANILDAGDIPIERIERGGEVTYHGPGQLMIYAIVKITSVVGFLERIAGAICEGVAELGVPDAAWQREPAGVWCDGRREGGGAVDIARAPRPVERAKLAACGIHVARGVPVHGWALNVATPPEMWTRINPCGLSAPQISVAQIVGAPMTVEEAAIAVGPRVARALSVR